MAKIREESSTMFRLVCPKGHRDLSPKYDLGFLGIQYCVKCGEKLVGEVGKKYNFRCFDCQGSVNERWAHCPYCGGKL